jgi:hypothetical protein
MKKGLLITAFGVFTLFSSIGQQIGNSDMEGWDNLGTSNEEPTNWNSFKSGTGSLVGFASQQVQRSTAVRPGATGLYCARIWSKTTLNIVANGNMTLGQINMGSSTPSSSSNYNFSKTADANFSEALTASPDSLVFWVKYTAASGNSMARVNAIIHDSYDLRDPQDANSLPHVVATATLNYSPTGGTWVRKSVPFNYAGPANNPQFILVTFTTNMTPGGGANNDEVLIDDIQLIYNPINQPIVANDDNVSTLEDVPVVISVTSNDVDPENGLVCGSINIVTPPSNGTLTIVPGSCDVTYTPNLGFFGSDSFTYSICDNGIPALCDQAVVSITVTEVVPGNNQIIANNDNATTDMNQPVVIDVVSNDVDAENQVVPGSVNIVTNPINGTVTVNSTSGSITYTPNIGWFGNDSFTYSICDGGTPVTCDTATVNITVNENVGLEDLNANEYHVYFSDNAINIVSLTKDIEGFFKLYNSVGKLVCEGELSKTINFNASSGIYYMEISGNKSQSFHKILKN